ncbi:MAG: aminotransferase class V-fold PLP-dependent enzyme [Myxococcota bacterium]
MIGSRALFPDLAARSYLAHCGISPVSTPVRAAVEEVLASYARLGVGALPRWLEQRAALRAAIARLVGARAEDVGLVANTTTGVIDVAWSLPWRAGDRVVVFEGEFPANVTPWQRAAAQFDLEVVRLPLDLDALARALRDGVRLVAVSAVQFQTGFAAPIHEMCHMCHVAGAELFVDAIQAVGVVPFSVGEIDYVSCGSHKWLMGIEGCGFVYIRPDRVGTLVPRLAGWLSHEDPVGFLFGGRLTHDRGFRARADVFEVGAANVAGLAALGAAIEVLPPVEAVFTHVQRWHDAIEPRLAERGFVSLRHPTGRSGILSLVPPVDAQHLVRGLAARGVVASAPEGNLRLAPSWPNAMDEVDAVVAAVDAVLA